MWRANVVDLPTYGLGGSMRDLWGHASLSRLPLAVMNGAHALDRGIEEFADAAQAIDDLCM